MKSFYLTVQSDGDTHMEEKNTISNFKVHFGHALDLKGKWEVALAEIFYSVQINLEDYLKNSHLTISKVLKDGTTTHHKISILDKSLPISEENIKTYLRQGFTSLDIISIWIDNKIRLSLPSSQKIKSVGIKIPKRLQDILGLIDCEITNNKVILGYNEIDLHRGLPQQIYLYTDIIHHQLVGTSHDKLLRIIPHDSKLDACNISFSRLHYYPVNQQQIRDLEIDIRDRDFNPISFHSGTSTLTLHFRQIFND